MLKTLTIGSCVSVQGKLVRNLDDGRIIVAVGEKQFTGFPTSQPQAQQAISSAAT